MPCCVVSLANPVYLFSPRWLLSKGRRDQAIKNLCWIRHLPADDIYIVEEIAFLDAALEEQAGGPGSSFWKPFKLVAGNRSVQWRWVPIALISIEGLADYDLQILHRRYALSLAEWQRYQRYQLCTSSIKFRDSRSTR